MQDIFPYESIRESQNELMQDISLAIRTQNHLIAHAPTGIGKSAAALASALDYAIKNKKTIFFITSKHTQHRIIIETACLINQKTGIITADFIGKKWMCGVPNVSQLSNPEFSEYCREMKEKDLCEYYNSTRKGMGLSFNAKKFVEENIRQPMHVEELCSNALKSRLCSYEITLEIAKQANLIIADYFHIIHPSIRKNLLAKIEKSLEDCIIIIDEAHNLPARARDLLTSTLNTFAIDAAIKEAKMFNAEKAVPKLELLKKILNTMVQEISIEQNEIKASASDFTDQVNLNFNYLDAIDEFEKIGEIVRETKKRSHIGGIASFLDSWLGPDYGFVRILRRGFSKKPYISLNYRCMDPSFCTKEIVQNAHSIICMSGTLAPLEMYRDLLGFESTALLRAYKNPFPEKNKLSLLVPETTTKFTSRSEAMFKRIAGIIAGISNTVPGNTLIFFPSYELRDCVYNYFKNISRKTALLEQKGLNKRERTEILEKFKSYKEHGAVLLAASAGSFGEGIDLIGDYLRAVLVVGLPLDHPNIETKALIDYYDSKFQKGWDYGYILPAITRVLQNIGRCIRSETDRGVVAFIDERYAWASYKRCFPDDLNIRISKNILSDIDNFFRGDKTRAMDSGVNS